MSPGAGVDDFMLFISSFSTAPTYFRAHVLHHERTPLHLFMSHIGSVHVGVSADPIAVFRHANSAGAAALRIGPSGALASSAGNAGR